MFTLVPRLHHLVADSARRWSIPVSLATAVFWAPLFGSIFFLFARTHKYFYRMMLTEDGPIEWSQFVCFLAAGLAALGIAHYRSKSGHLRQACLFILFALAMGFISGEEIAWGQRVFGIETPDAIRAINKQKEITVHNIGSALKFFRLTMFCVALISGTAFLWNRIIRIGRFQNDGDYLFVPPVFLAPTFLVMVVYRATRASVLTTPGFTVTAYSEWAEFCLAFGLFAYVGLNYRRYAMANAMQEAAVISVAPAMPVPVAAQPETVRIS